MRVNGFLIPEELLALLNAGHWPQNEDEAGMQNLRSPIPPEHVKRIAADESMIYLYPPPFCTVEWLYNRGEKFWQTAFAAPHEIVTTHCIPIGDFGLGSDAPVMLNYHKDEVNPSVIRLQWAERSSNNHWVSAASSFNEFSQLLELSTVQFKRPGTNDQ